VDLAGGDWYRDPHLTGFLWFPSVELGGDASSSLMGWTQDTCATQRENNKECWENPEDFKRASTPLFWL
jgi:hypothetical protein